MEFLGSRRRSTVSNVSDWVTWATFAEAAPVYCLFSAGCSLAEGQRSVHVPPTFKPLNVGPIIYGQPLLPGHLSTNTVRETGVGFDISMSSVPCVCPVVFLFSSISDVRSRMLEPGLSISFELVRKQGAALVTKYRTYREDAELESAFKAYTKRHYDSWVSFAHDAEHGEDIRSVTITGADRTRDFATMACGNNGVSFTTSVPMVAPASASAWATWRTEGLVHTNCDPQMCSPLVMAAQQLFRVSSSGINNPTRKKALVPGRAYAATASANGSRNSVAR